MINMLWSQEYIMKYLEEFNNDTGKSCLNYIPKLAQGLYIKLKTLLIPLDYQMSQVLCNWSRDME